MTWNKKIALIASSIFIITILVIPFILPSIIKTKAIEAISKETGRKVSIERISLNPLTLSASIEGFALQKVSSNINQLSFKNIETSLSIASLFKGAVVLNSFTITKPEISFTRTAANSYDFSDIIELQSKKPKTEKKGDTQFSISNIKIIDGSINFDDTLINGIVKKNRIQKIELAIPNISNFPNLIETASAPRFSATINGSPFTLSGTTKPFSKSLETSLHIDLKNVNIPEYLGYVPAPLPVKIANGMVSVNGDIIYRVSADKKPEVQINGDVGVKNLTVNLKNGQPLLKLPSLDIKASKLDLLNEKYLIDTITFSDLELFVSRTKNGEWNYQNLIAQKNTSKTDTKKSVQIDSNRIKPHLQIAAFGIHNAAVHFRDAVPQNGFYSDIDQIDLDINGFSTQEGTSAEYALSLLIDQQTDVNLDGSFTQKPLKVSSLANVENLHLERFYPYYNQFLTAPIKGIFNCSGEGVYDDKGTAISKLNLLLSKLSTSYGDKEKFELSSFELKDASYNQLQNRFESANIKLSRGTVATSKEVDGSLSLLTLLQKQKNKSNTPIVKTAAPTADKQHKNSLAKEFSWKIGKLELNHFNTSFTDKTRPEKPQFNLTNTNLAVSNLQGPNFTPAGFQFSSTFNKETPLSAKGVLTPQPFHYKGNIMVGRLPLRDFEAYFPENVNIFIVGGNAETAMNVDISLKDGKPFGTYKGNAALREFHAVDTKAEEDLLKWESLQLDDIQGTLEPFSLALHQIALNSVYSRIIIRKDGTINLQNLVNPTEKPAKQVNVDDIEKQKKSPLTAQSEQNKQIRIDAITIQDGTLAFTDTHLPRSFETTFFNLGGRVSGLTSEDAKFADVDLRGNLENHSPLLITGKINPLRSDLFVDLKVSFKDIELSPITPYTATFLGYPVEKGKLFLDLKYLIDKKELKSENKVFIDQFTLGDKVESDKATSLPVKLGLALLKDRKGEIHLDLPVTGRTDDPKFSIWGVVWQVVKNVLTKAVTSPFSLLSSMFGSGEEDFSSIQFSIGSSTLSATEEQKLATLAKALLARPALKMELKGYVDPERDAEGYRGELLQRKIIHEKALTLSAKKVLITPDKKESMEISVAEYSKLLKAVYKKEKFPKPRNAIGMVKDLPVDEMKKLIIANTTVGEQELRVLAHERVVSVFDNLIKKGRVPIERIFQKNDVIFKKTTKENANRSRVEINALAQ